MSRSVSSSAKKEVNPKFQKLQDLLTETLVGTPDFSNFEYHTKRSKHFPSGNELKSTRNQYAQSLSAELRHLAQLNLSSTEGVFDPITAILEQEKELLKAEHKATDLVTRDGNTLMSADPKKEARYLKIIEHGAERSSAVYHAITEIISEARMLYDYGNSTAGAGSSALAGKKSGMVEIPRKDLRNGDKFVDYEMADRLEALRDLSKAQLSELNEMFVEIRGRTGLKPSDSPESPSGGKVETGRGGGCCEVM